MRFGFLRFLFKFYNFSELMLGRSREDSKDEHMHLSDAVLESVMVFRLGAGAAAVAEVVVPLYIIPYTSEFTGRALYAYNLY